MIALAAASTAPLQVEFCHPMFFQVPPKKIKTVDEGTGRVYLVWKDTILAVAKETR